MAFKRLFVALSGLALTFMATTAQAALPSETSKWTAADWARELGLEPLNKNGSIAGARPSDLENSCVVGFGHKEVHVANPTDRVTQLLVTNVRSSTELHCSRELEVGFTRINSKYRGLGNKLDQVSSTLAGKAGKLRVGGQYLHFTSYRGLKIMSYARRKGPNDLLIGLVIE